MVYQVVCPLCKGDLHNVFMTRDYLVSHEQFEILECSHCQLRVTSPFPEIEIIGRYYQSDAYISHGIEVRSLQDVIYNLVRSYMVGSKKRLVEKSTGKTRGKILDIGCGAGHFLNIMQSGGWEVRGLDSSPKMRALVLSQLGIKVFEPNEWLNSKESYDLITCWHSLEHIHKPWDYLIKIKQQLHQDGILVVALPNYHSVDAQYYRHDWAAYDTPRHLYHFTPYSMSKLMHDYGFKITQTLRLSFDSFYVSLLSAKHQNSSQVTALWLGFRSWILSLFLKQKCSSLIYIMKHE